MTDMHHFSILFWFRVYLP